MDTHHPGEHDIAEFRPPISPEAKAPPASVVAAAGEVSGAMHDSAADRLKEFNVKILTRNNPEAAQAIRDLNRVLATKVCPGEMEEDDAAIGNEIAANCPGADTHAILTLVRDAYGKVANYVYGVVLKLDGKVVCNIRWFGNETEKAREGDSAPGAPSGVQEFMQEVQRYAAEAGLPLAGSFVETFDDDAAPPVYAEHFGMSQLTGEDGKPLQLCIPPFGQECDAEGRPVGDIRNPATVRQCWSMSSGSEFSPDLAKAANAQLWSRVYADIQRPGDAGFKKYIGDLRGKTFAALDSSVTLTPSSLEQ